MAERRLDLRKDVFNKTQYIKTINTSFGELGTTSITEDIQLAPSTDEFFKLYNSLFYDIQALGETNSHQYLVRTSGEYINFDEISEEVQALQAEIAQLRQELLNAQMENIRIAATGSNDPATNEAVEVFTKQISTANQELIDTATSLSDQTNTSTNTPPASGQSSGGGSGNNNITNTGFSSGGSGGGFGGGSNAGGAGGSGY